MFYLNNYLCTNSLHNAPLRNNFFNAMPTKRLFVPDDIICPSTTNKNIRLLQYVNATGQENFDAFLTHHALVYILTGVKQIKIAQSQFNIHPGELLLIPRGEYVMSEYIAGESGFQSIMLFFSKKVAQDLVEQLNTRFPAYPSDLSSKSKVAVKIIPHSEDIERLFSSLVAYSTGNSSFTFELIRLKFLELIYLLLDSPYQKLISSFLFDAALSESPELSTVLNKYLYTPATIKELARLSGRSLSSFKREFSREYGEAPQTWIRSKKLTHAAYLLDTTDYTIEEIAENSGFVTGSHFARLFKIQFGATPTEYRIRIKDR